LILNTKPKNKKKTQRKGKPKNKKKNPKNMTAYLPFTVYKNVMRFLEFRKLTLVSGNIVRARGAKQDPEPLNETKFIEMIQIDGYVIIEAKDHPDKQRRFPRQIPLPVQALPVQTYIAIVEPNNKAANASAEFEKMLKNIPEFGATKRTTNLDIIIITKELFKTNIVNKVEPFLSNGTGGLETPNPQGFLHINNHGYKVFTMVIPEHKMVHPHRILGDDEAKKVLAEIHAKKSDIPKISKLDPAVTGDILEILVPSETVGTEIHYRCTL
jgi:DNA-directed RNA polymerase subunit H (RpoH/RPB5)